MIPLSSISATWTVVILADDRELHRLYHLTPNTPLSQVLQSWRHDCRLFGTWLFASVNGETEYDIEHATLEMVGEVYPNAGAVTLRAQLSKETGSKRIFVYLREELHQVMVTQHQRLRDVLWPLAKRPLSFEYDGVPLDPKMTVKQAGLQNDAVVYESGFQVLVKLSTGETRTIHLEANSLVLQLIDRVRFHEDDEIFSLTLNEKPLELCDSAQDLKAVVTVARCEFLVKFRHRRVRFQAKREAITFSDLVSTLATKTQLDTQTLEDIRYYCTGCQRCVCKAATMGYEQVMPVNCCEARSLDLVAKPACETSESKINDNITNLDDSSGPRAFIECMTKL